MLRHVVRQCSRLQPQLVRCLVARRLSNPVVRLDDVQDHIAVIVMDCNDNRINSQFLDHFNAALDLALSDDEVRAVVTTGQGKFYSNGDDLAWLKQMHKTDTDHIVKFLQRSRQLQVRLLTCPLLTVAAINGHAFAGGAMLALSHDVRAMQSERGWLCLNEALLGIRLPRWLVHLCRLKFGHAGARAVLDTAYARRLTGEEAKNLGVVDAVCPPDDLLTTARRLVNSALTSDPVDREFVRYTKRQIYADVLEAMRRSELSAAKSQLSVN